jgi:hypothetical protein
LSNTEVEQALAAHPELGDSKRILDELWMRFDMGVELLGMRWPQARAFVASWVSAGPRVRQRALGHPAVRNTLHRLSAGGQAPAAEELELLTSALELLSTSSAGSWRSPLRPYGAGPGSELLDPHLAALFDAELADDVGSGPVTLRSPSEAEDAALEAAWRRVCLLWPQLGPSLAGHSSVLAVFDGPALSSASVTKHAIPGAVFLAPSSLGDPWALVEALVHEMAHKKLSDVADMRQLMRQGYTAAVSRTAVISWRDGARWPGDRVLYALHVYVHLAALLACADRPGADQPLARAKLLVEAAQGPVAEELGDTGRDAVTWLAGVLSRLS